MALSFNPQDLPAIQVDSHLPAIDAAQLLPLALRKRFLNPPMWEPELWRDARLATRAPAAASVLVPLVLRPQLTVLFTRRTDHLSDHAGQISFPGGRAESHDVDEVATALREAEEEIGLQPQHVNVLGNLPTYTTVTGFVVTPVIALVQPDMNLMVDPFEVAEVFEVPLAFLMNPANHRHHQVDVAGVRRAFMSMPWPGDARGATEQPYYIWGATAAMLRNFYRFLIA